MRKLIAVAVLLAGAVMLWPSRSRAKGPCAVPKAWGEIRGAMFQPWSTGVMSVSLVLFEAQDGTARVVRADNCKEIDSFTRE